MKSGKKSSCLHLKLRFISLYLKKKNSVYFDCMAVQACKNTISSHTLVTLTLTAGIWFHFPFQTFFQFFFLSFFLLHPNLADRRSDFFLSTIKLSIWLYYILKRAHAVCASSPATYGAFELTQSTKTFSTWIMDGFWSQRSMYVETNKWIMYIDGVDIVAYSFIIYLINFSWRKMSVLVTFQFVV